MMRYAFHMYKMRLQRRSKVVSWVFLCMWTYFLIGDLVRGYVFFTAMTALFVLENLYCITSRNA
ncbi:hypothetical protein AN477_15240 [Alicyclobacillus ferrooxydans]|uniref:Uncharacterized protein n=1 Tax=Alicyclobacillus ferrooxydans TaxID=471514 RepID=A0A0P9CBR7_9BACL|nr:hypothetical protein AN477_15240 [Alicyclobacillus ferrooxydans]